MLIICLQPEEPSKSQREGKELETFWEHLGEKSEYPSKKIPKDHEGDPHLFSCEFLNGTARSFVIFPLLLFIE